jgi:hypothetical protein
MNHLEIRRSSSPGGAVLQAVTKTIHCVGKAAMTVKNLTDFGKMAGFLFI